MGKTSNYTPKTVFHNDDLLDFSNTEDNGLTYDRSEKVTFLEFMTQINTLVENFASHDLIFPKNRIHNLNDFELGLINGPISIGSPTPDASAILDIVSFEKGFLTPRMTEERRDSIQSPSEGLEIYNLTTHKKNFYNGTNWEQVTSV